MRSTSCSSSRTTQKTLAEMNKLKVFSTTDLAHQSWRIANKFLGFAGGADMFGGSLESIAASCGCRRGAFH